MLVLRPALGAQLAEHAPGDPEQQQAARQLQPDDLEQFGVTAAKPMPSTVAPTTPQKMIRVRFSAGKPATARPMMMALSPDITRSISTTWTKARTNPSLRPSASTIELPGRSAYLTSVTGTSTCAMTS